MELLVAYQDDPAGHNMAKFLSKEMTKEGDIFRGKYYDLVIKFRDGMPWNSGCDFDEWCEFYSGIMENLMED